MIDPGRSSLHIYTLGEVSRYARVKPTTLRTWTHNGYACVIIPAIASGIAPFSFINFIELYVLEGLRRTHRLPMQRIRKGEESLRRTYGVSYPLAESNLKTDGYDLFIRESEFPLDSPDLFP